MADLDYVTINRTGAAPSAENAISLFIAPGGGRTSPTGLSLKVDELRTIVAKGGNLLAEIDAATEANEVDVDPEIISIEEPGE